MSIAGAIMVPHPPLIIPEVGRGKEKEISLTIRAYEEAARQLALWQPESVVVATPHSIMYADYFHISPGEYAEGDFGQFGAENVCIQSNYDTELVEELCRICAAEQFPAGTAGERNPNLDYGTMIPLYFLNKYCHNYKVVRIGISGLSLREHERLGDYIRQAAKKLDRRIAFIASGDLSHRLREDGPYGYHPSGPEYDSKIMKIMGEGAFEQIFDFKEDMLTDAAECGHRTFAMLAGVLRDSKVRAEKLSYEGTFGVGYGVCTFGTAAGDDAASAYRDDYTALAKLSLETYVRSGKKLKLTEELEAKLPEEMLTQRAGAFVSLKKEGKLRGCIGTIQGVQRNLAEEIMENAVSAGVYDPRFAPVVEEELPELVYSVDVLGEAERIAGPEQLDVKRYGVIVTKGYRRGLLLPNLEGIDTVEEQVAIAMQKAGISDAQGMTLERFEVIRHQ